jgi:hypothetical protein
MRDDEEKEEPEEPAEPRGPRILAPLVAAGMIALSLERLGFLAWPAALVLFLLLGLIVAMIAARSRRSQSS